MPIERLIFAPLWMAPFLIGLLLMAAPLVIYSTPASAQVQQLPTEHLRALRKRMNSGAEMSNRDLRELADAADGMAAFQYAKRLEATGKDTLLPDAAHYYAIASYTDRDYAVKRLASLLNSDKVTLGPGRLRSALDALTRQATTGNTDAAIALSQMYDRGHPFGRDPVAMRRWLAEAAKAGSGPAALKLALALMLPQDGALPDLAAAREALTLLATQDNPGMKATAATLLARLDAMPAPALPPAAPLALEGITQ